MYCPWKNEEWFVSPFSYDDDFVDRSRYPKRIGLCDSTLCDGEKQAGVYFTKDAKVRIAKALDRIRVDRIELGNPGLSPDDMEVVCELAKAHLKAKLSCNCRNNSRDIDAAMESGSWGVAINVPASPFIIREMQSAGIEETISGAIKNIDYAKSEGLAVTTVLMDATRSDLKLLERIVSDLGGHSDCIALGDTFGVAIPPVMKKLVENMGEWTDKPLEVQCNNDFGLATANALAAISAGASRVKVTVNSLGERSGATSLQEVALGAKLLLGVDLELRTKELYRISRLVGELSGFRVPPNKPVVGDNIFKIETTQSGVRVQSKDGRISPFSWELIGHPSRGSIMLSRKSGPQNLELKLSELGLRVDKEMYPIILSEVYEKSMEKNGAVTDDEFLEILQDFDLCDND
jgi:2-isopropylmalate synthase